MIELWSESCGHCALYLLNILVGQVNEALREETAADLASEPSALLHVCEQHALRVEPSNTSTISQDYTSSLKTASQDCR